MGAWVLINGIWYKDIVSTVCVGWLETRRFTAGNCYTPDGWQTVIDIMQKFGAEILPGRKAYVRDYLVANWPEKPKLKAVVIPGPVKVEFKSWPVPTPGSRPHDSVATPDGAIWWSGQSANKLGRLDPNTGEMKEFPLKSKLAGPHGLIYDKDGNIWYAANWGNHIGMLNPGTGQID
jgi:virginiamycin B lyase